MQRKTILIFSLSIALVIALMVIISQEDLRERLGETYWVIALAIIGCVLLVLAGYVWDHTLLQRVKTLKDSAQLPAQMGDPGDESDPDEIIGLARKIERMARSLQTVEAGYRGIVEDQVDLICRYRADGKLTFVNGAYARAFGRKRTELIGQPFPYMDACGPADSEGVSTFERELDLPDARRIWVTWTQRINTDQTGEMLEYQAVGHDVTARRDAEAALLRAKLAAEEADRAKSEFLAMVSHEIRTPINGVVGFSRLLADTPLSPMQREQLAMIRSSGLALEKLIGDILDLSKIEAGKVEIEQTPFSPAKCIEEVRAFFADQAREASLRLEVHTEADVPVLVSSDEGRLRQILINLVGNALKFTERGGVTVRLSCTRSDLAPDPRRKAVRLFIAVTDTGIGIPLDKQALLFQPFSQVDTSSKRRRSGTGLGLIISKRLCELMGGTISVESRPGEGTTFRFSIAAVLPSEETLAPFNHAQAKTAVG